MYQKFFKRFLDVFLASIGIVVLSPLFLIISLLVKQTKGPILFRQKRVGKNKRLFEIYKFRSMYADTPQDVPTHLLEDPSKRITPIGHFLRKSSLDELPQLFNILKGDMSIVGPRPALWNQYDLVTERNKYGANNCLPGLTGYAQIHGRDELPIPFKAKLDGFYVKHLSFYLDAHIFVKTIFSVARSEGIVEGKQKNLSNKRYKSKK